MNGHTSGLLIGHVPLLSVPSSQSRGVLGICLAAGPGDVGGCVSSRRVYTEIGEQRSTAHRGFCPRELLVNRTSVSWLLLLSGIYFTKYENSSSKRILSTQSSWITVGSLRVTVENVSRLLLRWT
ncbi:unnamed protein product [Gulo gulo]|uniref:Uncharacterized protein n=1 Tax=Gulo gulo TaxID=48420 RepID=A0A9X9LSV2_GULGU|nr:unnamed protein product [Gulo gulo]